MNNSTYYQRKKPAKGQRLKHPKPDYVVVGNNSGTTYGHLYLLDKGPNQYYSLNTNYPLKGLPRHINGTPIIQQEKPIFCVSIRDTFSIVPFKQINHLSRLNEKNHLAQLQPNTSKDIKLTKNTNPIKDKLKIPASLPFVTQPRHTSFTHQLTMPRRQAIVQARTV
ncbi:MAG: hypothetical protein MK137_03905 [Rickettsiales bacterium]|nr:hypothetical protein [Rickettsiales bacterium]